MIALPEAPTIDTPQAFAALLEKLIDEPLIALDTESSSKYEYYERTCLIQLSTYTQDYVIDPLVLDAEMLHDLTLLTANSDIQIVMHAGDNDIRALKRDFGVSFSCIFDTMHSARILGYRKAGLNHLLKRHFGVKTDKRFQLADWRQRPLSGEQLHYAQMDTHYLPQLYTILKDELIQAGAWDEAQEFFTDLTLTPTKQHTPDENGFWDIRHTADFTPRQWAILRELYLWREGLAQAQNIHVQTILTDEQLRQLADTRLYSTGDLYRSQVLQTNEYKQYAKDILNAHKRGRRAKPPKRHRAKRYTPQEIEIYQHHENLYQWRKERALDRGVDSDIILSKDTLWEIARLQPQSIKDLESVLGAWRLKTYGQELLDIIADA